MSMDEKLCDDILFNILCWVPAGYLIRYKVVNKQWHSLISDPKLQRANFERCTPRNRLLLNYHSKDQILSIAYEEEEESELQQEVVEYVQRINEIDGMLPPWRYNTVGSFNGLVCLIVCDEDYVDIFFVLWNPTTRESRVLPRASPGFGDGKRMTCATQQLSGTLTNYFFGLGYDTIGHDYKLLLGKFPESLLHIYSLRSNSWRRIDFKLYSSSRPNPIPQWCKASYCHGSLHWLPARGNKKIISFDLSADKFYETLDLPSFAINNRVNGFGVTAGLGDDDDCSLFVVRYRDEWSSDVWAMKEYGNNSSWTQVCSSLPTLCKDDIYSFISPIPPNTPIAMTRGFDKILMGFGKEERTLFLHRLVQQFTTTTIDLPIKGSRCYDFYITYIETLVSPHHL